MNVAPPFDLWVDPADFVGVNCKLECYAVHTATQPPGNAMSVSASDIQLWNATDGVELASVNFNWQYVAYQLRSGLFQITGSGYKRLVVRARHLNDSSNALLEIWRVRLVINPSF